MIPLRKYIFDNLAYDDLMVRSFEICNFCNMGDLFSLQAVDLNIIQLNANKSS